MWPWPGEAQESRGHWRPEGGLGWTLPWDQPADTLILDLWPPEQGENIHFCSSELCGLCCFVTAAPGHSHRPITAPHTRPPARV